MKRSCRVTHRPRVLAPWGSGSLPLASLRWLPPFSGCQSCRKLQHCSNNWSESTSRGMVMEVHLHASCIPMTRNVVEVLEGPSRCLNPWWWFQHSQTCLSQHINTTLSISTSDLKFCFLPENKVSKLPFFLQFWFPLATVMPPLESPTENRFQSNLQLLREHHISMKF